VVVDWRMEEWRFCGWRKHRRRLLILKEAHFSSSFSSSCWSSWGFLSIVASTLFPKKIQIRLYNYRLICSWVVISGWSGPPFVEMIRMSDVRIFENGRSHTVLNLEDIVSFDRAEVTKVYST
jgi:hypothetical protein